MATNHGSVTMRHIIRSALKQNMIGNGVICLGTMRFVTTYLRMIVPAPTVQFAAAAISYTAAPVVVGNHGRNTTKIATTRTMRNACCIAPFVARRKKLFVAK